MKNQSGQSLIEITIMIGVAVVIVTGLVISVVNGLRNSQFAQAQTQATKLAQAGIDQVRIIRDRNYGMCLPSGPSGDQKWSAYWTFSCPVCNVANGCADSNNPNTLCTFNIKTDTIPSCVTNSSVQPFSLNSSVQPEVIAGTPFTRRILVEDYNGTPNSKKVTAIVKWTDSNGDHYSKVSTILADY